MYIEVVPNRNSRPAILLREGWREGKSIKKRTLANLTEWPAAKVEALRRVLKNEPLGDPTDAFDIVRSRPHGHVAAVLGSAVRLGLPRLLERSDSPERRCVLAMLVARLLAPRSKLATARALHRDTLSHTLGEALALEAVDEAALYAAMDWLLARQGRIERALARRHLHDGAVVLYDLSSSYFEGHCCALAQRGYSRDGRRDRAQIVFGLLCTAAGCPVAVEVFAGNTADPCTLGAQIEKLRRRFGVRRVVLVGDRGMLTEARIDEELRGHQGLDWISALRAPAIAKLLAAGSVQLSLFDERNLLEVHSDAYPGERLIVCRNPLLAEQRRHKREALLGATETLLEEVRTATARTVRPLRGQEKIALRVGRILNRYKVAKHFVLSIEETRFAYRRDEAKIAAEAALDGLYVIRTSVPASTLDAPATVRTYKMLSRVERAFRSFKSVDLEVRPIFHHLEDRVRAHVFLCMLAYYLEWHMRQALAPLLFDDEDRAGAEAQRVSVVDPAQRSPSARDKAARKRTADGAPVHDFHSLLADLATIVKNRIVPKQPGATAFDVTTRPTALQQRALDLLQVRL
jgi:Transposase DDE domain